MIQGRLLALSVFGVMGCIPQPDQGIAVGNPTVLALQLANGDGVDFTSATGDASTVWLTGADTTCTLATDATLNLLSDTSIQPPPGEWTALTFKFPGGIALTAAGVERTVPVSSVVVVGSFSTNGSLVLRFGAANWVDAATWQTGSDSEIAVLLEAGTALYKDDDGDSWLDEAEEAEGSLACEDCEDPDDGDDTGRDTGSDQMGEHGSGHAGAHDYGGAPSSQ